MKTNELRDKFHQLIDSIDDKALLQKFYKSICNERDSFTALSDQLAIDFSGKLSDEIWLPVVEYEGEYEVSNCGQVRSVNKFIKNGSKVKYERKGQIIRPLPHGQYYQLSLSSKSKHRHYLVHVLVARAFLPNPDNKPIVNHKDGNPSNNQVNNLEWTTPKENSQHASKTGLLKLGENSASSKLTTEQVLQIRNEYKKGQLGFGEIALSKKFGVSKIAIHNIVHRTTWKDI